MDLFRRGIFQCRFAPHHEPERGVCLSAQSRAPARTSRWLRAVQSADVGRRECHTIARPFDHVRTATGRSLAAPSRNGLYALVPLQRTLVFISGQMEDGGTAVGRLEPVVQLQLNVLGIRCEVADFSPSYRGYSVAFTRTGGHQAKESQ